MYLLDILSTAYHPHSQGSLSTRVRHGRGVKTANYGSSRVNRLGSWSTKSEYIEKKEYSVSRVLGWGVGV